MRRFNLSLLLALISQGIVLLILCLTPHTSLPPILDYVIAPGLIPAVIWVSSNCGLPPWEAEAARRDAVIVGGILNFVAYAITIYGILCWRGRNVDLRRRKGEVE